MFQAASRLGIGDAEKPFHRQQLFLAQCLDEITTGIVSRRSRGALVIFGRGSFGPINAGRRDRGMVGAAKIYGSRAYEALQKKLSQAGECWDG